MTDIVKKATIRNAPFWVCLAISIGLIIAGFVVPPTGEIDGSVLTATGILFAFATLWVVWNAMKLGVDAKLIHGNTTLAIGDLDNQPTTLQDDEAEID